MPGVLFVDEVSSARTSTRRTHATAASRPPLGSRSPPKSLILSSAPWPLHPTPQPPPSHPSTRTRVIQVPSKGDRTSHVHLIISSRKVKGVYGCRRALHSLHHHQSSRRGQRGGRAGGSRVSDSEEEPERHRASPMTRDGDTNTEKKTREREAAAGSYCSRSTSACTHAHATARIN